MSAPSKRRTLDAEELNSNSDISDDDDSMEEDDALQQTVQIEFEACAPEGGDFDGIQRLLRQLFLKAHVDVSALADIIVQQNHVGSVIRQSELPEEELDDEDDDEDIIFGLTSVINLTHKKDLECVQKICDLILEKCQEHGSNQEQALFKNVLEKSQKLQTHTGLIISERLVNIPAQIAAPLFENLCKEMNAANDKKKDFNFDHFLLICKFYKMEVRNGKKTLEKIVWSKPEEEIFCEESLASFEYSILDQSDTALEGEWDADGEGMKPFHRVVLIPANRLPHIVSKIRETFVAS